MTQFRYLRHRIERLQCPGKNSPVQSAQGQSDDALVMPCILYMHVDRIGVDGIDGELCPAALHQ